MKTPQFLDGEGRDQRGQADHTAQSDGVRKRNPNYLAQLPAEPQLCHAASSSPDPTGPRPCAGRLPTAPPESPEAQSL